MIEEEIKQIIVDTGYEKGRNRVVANLKKCSICNLGFSISDPCVMCQMRMDEEKRLGRKMTQEEWDKLFEWLE
jgi:hypothetical protein